MAHRYASSISFRWFVAILCIAFVFFAIHRHFHLSWYVIFFLGAALMLQVNRISVEKPGDKSESGSTICLSRLRMPNQPMAGNHWVRRFFLFSMVRPNHAMEANGGPLARSTFKMTSTPPTPLDARSRPPSPSCSR